MLRYGACEFCTQVLNNKCKWSDVCDSHNYYCYDKDKAMNILEKNVLKASNNIKHDTYDAMCYAIDTDEEWMKGQLNAWLKHNPYLFVKDIRTVSRKEHSDMKMPEIKNVKFNDPATIVFWSDGTKTVVKAGENDVFDPEKGLAMAIVKKVYGNVGRYYNNIGKWVDGYYAEKEKEKEEKITLDEVKDAFKAFANIKFGI